MEVRGQIRAAAAFPQERTLDVLEKRKICFPYRDMNPGQSSPALEKR